MEVKVKKLDIDSKLPVKASEGAACYDVRSIENFLFLSGEAHMLRTGLAFEVPDGYGLEVRPRSGLASMGLILQNSPGTLDNDYRGELLMSMRNVSNKNIMVRSGDRIAQIKLERLVDTEFIEMEELGSTIRGPGGFGSTGAR